MRSLPAVVRNKAVVAGATGWLADLPALVTSLEHEWDLAVGDAFADATEAFVAPATAADGTPVVLKLVVPRDGDAARREITALRLAGGAGCARLLRADEERGAILLERLGPSLADLELPLGQRLEILCEVAGRMWRPAAGADLPTGASKGHWLAETIASSWERLDRPCTERAVQYALDCAAKRTAAHDDERAVLVHGDLHQWNTLRSGAGFKLVDPDGLLAEPEYDLGIVMREDPLDLLRGAAPERARRLAACTGRDATAIWEWGVVERVSTGLLATEIDLQPEGRAMLHVAEVVADPRSGHHPGDVA